MKGSDYMYIQVFDKNNKQLTDNELSQIEISNKTYYELINSSNNKYDKS